MIFFILFAFGKSISKIISDHVPTAIHEYFQKIKQQLRLISVYISC